MAADNEAQNIAVPVPKFSPSIVALKIDMKIENINDSSRLSKSTAIIMENPMAEIPSAENFNIFRLTKARLLKKIGVKNNEIARKTIIIKPTSRRKSIDGGKFSIFGAKIIFA